MAQQRLPQISKVENLATIVNGKKSWTIAAILDDCDAPGHASLMTNLFSLEKQCEYCGAVFVIRSRFNNHHQACRKRYLASTSQNENTEDTQNENETEYDNTDAPEDPFDESQSAISNLNSDTEIAIELTRNSSQVNLFASQVHVRVLNCVIHWIYVVKSVDSVGWGNGKFPLHCCEDLNLNYSP